ncbi:uncharacterized protein LOC131055449 isoform X1 [Cryptomeria japonica]|uniref:uncharacterized protein LOC131055449 isoform X1 n=1 Tax=Cryptomeria japonica TaxID=3369 RepID=UPI0025AC7CA6|nr:uncharacterized protein LOC131055449 isoform X1 [Cryptomeria japonica]
MGIELSTNSLSLMFCKMKRGLRKRRGLLFLKISSSKLVISTMNRCLRVLITPEDTGIVNGECKGAFENLRLLSLNSHNHSLMELSKHPRLAVFIGEFKTFNLSGLASSSKYLALRWATLAELSTTFSQLQSLRFLKLWHCDGFDSLPETIVNLSALEKLDISDRSSVSLPDSFGQLRSLRYLTSECISALPESFGNLASLELLTLNFCRRLSNLPQNFGQLNRLKYLNIYCCEGLQSLSGDFECLSSLLAIKASGCSRLEGNTMDKLGKMKGLLIVDIYKSPFLQERWEQVKGQYSLAVLPYIFTLRSGTGVYPHADVMCRAFFHSESKFLHVDENGQFGESSCPVGGVKLSLLLTMCDLSAAANRRYLEAVRKRWEEVGGGEMMMMVFVDMGGSCREESERRVRGILPYLPRGSTAWIAPDNRARLLFAHSLFKANSLPEYEPTVIVSISTSMDEEGKRNMMFHDFIIPDYTSDFEYARIFDQLFSPILQAHASLQFHPVWDNFREF